MQRIDLCCNTCLNPNALLKCARCLSARYCDPTCQRADWPSYKSKCSSVTNEYKQGISNLREALANREVGRVAANIYRRTGKAVGIRHDGKKYWLTSGDLTVDEPILCGGMRRRVLFLPSRLIFRMYLLLICMNPLRNTPSG